MKKGNILICGHKSFAAKGLDGILRKAGWTVFTFTRGSVGKRRNAITGPVAEIGSNPHLQQRFECVINYILLKDEGIESNVAYVDPSVPMIVRHQ